MNHTQIDRSELLLKVYNDAPPPIKGDNEIKSAPPHKFYDWILKEKIRNVSFNIFIEIAHFFLNLFCKEYKEDFKSRLSKQISLSAEKDELRIKDKKVEDRCLAISNKNYNKDKVLFLQLSKDNWRDILLNLSLRDVTRFLRTAKIAKTKIDMIIHNRLDWAKIGYDRKFPKLLNRLPYQPTIPHPQQMKMYQEVGIEYPQLIEALGGLKAVHEFPVLKIDDSLEEIEIKHEDFTHSGVIRGFWDNRPFIAVSYFSPFNKKRYIALFIRDRSKLNTDMWHCIDDGTLGCSRIEQFGRTRFSNKSDFCTLREQEILSRLKRLINHEKIGILRDVVNIEENFPPVIPNRDMKNKDGVLIMGGFYEVKPRIEELTALALWDPKKTMEENLETANQIKTMEENLEIAKKI